MEHLKHFFKQKGLYLACLAVVFAATAAGVLALRSVLDHVVELTGTAQEETLWQDDRKQTRYDPARAGAYACACLIGIAVLGCCFRCARCIAHTRRFCRAVRCCGKAFGLLAG